MIKKVFNGTQSLLKGRSPNPWFQAMRSWWSRESEDVVNLLFSNRSATSWKKKIIIWIMCNDHGQLWENYLITERIKHQSYSGLFSNNFFWRTYTGAEIDWIEERQGKLYAYEFKYGSKTIKIATVTNRYVVNCIAFQVRLHRNCQS